MNEQAEYDILFDTIQGKVVQVLRIEQKLQERKKALFDGIRTSTNNKDSKKYLLELINTYAREKRVFHICSNGLNNTEQLLREIKHSNKAIPFWVRAKNKIPFTKKDPNNPLSLLIFLRALISILNKEVNRLEGEIIIIRNIVKEQQDIAEELFDLINSGSYSFVLLSETPLFKRIQALYDQEQAIIKKSENKSCYGHLLKVLPNFKEGFMRYHKIAKEELKRYPKLAALQAGLWAAPIIGPSTAAGLFFGPEFAALFFGLANLIKYSPSLIGGILIYTRRNEAHQPA